MVMLLSADTAQFIDTHFERVLSPLLLLAGIVIIPSFIVNSIRGVSEPRARGSVEVPATADQTEVAAAGDGVN